MHGRVGLVSKPDARSLCDERAQRDDRNVTENSKETHGTKCTNGTSLATGANGCKDRAALPIRPVNTLNECEHCRTVH